MNSDVIKKVLNSPSPEAGGRTAEHAVVNSTRCLSAAAAMGFKKLRRRSAFTLIEVLATLLLLAIVFPSINKALIASATAGNEARHRTEASSLARSKLSELITAYTWNGNGPMQGDFSADWPAYRWKASVSAWTGDTQNVGLSQLDVTISWTDRGREQTLTVSSLVYVRPIAASTTS